MEDVLREHLPRLTPESEPQDYPTWDKAPRRQDSNRNQDHRQENQEHQDPTDAKTLRVAAVAATPESYCVWENDALVPQSEAIPVLSR